MEVAWAGVEIPGRGGGDQRLEAREQVTLVGE
jgi:hypothetical protein